jgi:hypothetical protein
MTERLPEGTLVFYAADVFEVNYKWHRARVHRFDEQTNQYELHRQLSPTRYDRDITRVPVAWVEAEVTEDCIHEEMDYMGLPYLEMQSVPQTWLPGAPVIPGSVWCYTHARHETKEEQS